LGQRAGRLWYASGVTPPEARARLGLPPEGPLPPADLKRAYLQAVKRHKPEVDPEGFQQVRQAYELLDRMARLGVDAPGLPVGRDAPPTAAAPESAVEEGSDGAPPEDAAIEEPRSDHLEPYRARLREMFGLPWPLRAKVGWDAYEAFPNDVAAREFLLELLPREARTDIISVLLEGVRVGDASCLWRLLHFAPASVPVDALERLERDGGPYERILAAQARLERGEGDRAEATMTELLAAAGPLPEPMLVHGMLRMILACEKDEAAERAGRLLAQLKQYVGGTSLPVDAASAELSAMFALTMELGAATYLAPGIRREVAHGILDGQFGGLLPVIAAARGTLGRGTVDDSLNRLEREAPVLGPIVRLYREPPEEIAPRSGSNAWHWLWVLLVVGGFLARAGNSCSSSPSFEANATIAKAIATESGKASMLSAFEYEAARLCNHPSDLLLCQEMPGFLRSLRGPQILELRQKQMDLFLAAATSDEAKAFVARLETVLPVLCGQ
jgi:hypothetical protein